METLSTSEVAVVASVSQRDVNRIVDERILPETIYVIDDDRFRRFYVDAAAWINFYFTTADHLSSDVRIRTIATAIERARRDRHWERLWAACCKNIALSSPGIQESLDSGSWLIRWDFLEINMVPFIRRTCERLARLIAARGRVVSDPEILGGIPVFSGTRVPVYDVAASMAAGLSVERIQSAYPSLGPDDIEFAALYAEANPPRGRPRHRSVPPDGSVILSYRVPRKSRH